MRILPRLLRLLLLATLSLAPRAWAYNGSVQFSAAEIAAHRVSIARIVEDAASCMREDLDKHRSFISRHGISAFYGDHSTFALVQQLDENGKVVSERSTTLAEKWDTLRKLGIQENLIPQFVPDRRCGRPEDCPLALEPTSCIGLALKCLGRGFVRAGFASEWSRIRAFVKANNVEGGAFQFALQRLGWKLAFWNPAPRLAEEWDSAERATFPSRRGEHRGVWGQHARSLREVTREGRYDQNRIDDAKSLVDFGETTPDLLRRTPFFVGIAHRGYHVFGGAFGQVLESHSTRLLTDYYSLESSDFNPLSKTGGPRGGPYKSGVIALPPGYLEWDLQP